MPTADTDKIWLAFDHRELPSVLSAATQRAPVAVGDVFTTGNDTPLVIAEVALQADDADPDGDPFSMTAFDATSTAGGSVVDNGNGTFTYTPASLFTGADSFTYTICDSPWNDCDAATVTIAVGEVVRFLGSVANGESYDLDSGAPTAALGLADPALDYEGDSDPGETIREGSGLSTEPDPNRRQWWDEVATLPVDLSGEAKLTLWSSGRDLVNSKSGDLFAYLLECNAGDIDGSTCSEFAAASVVSDPWGAPDGDFVRHDADFADVTHTVPAGKMLRLMITTTDADGGILWAGFDTVDYPSVLAVGFNATPVTVDDAFETATDAPLIIPEEQLTGNDGDPDGDPTTLVSVDDGGAAGTAVLFAGTVTYTPAAGWSGLDEFTYQLCDPFGACGTGIARVAVGTNVLFLGSAGPARVAVLPLRVVPTTTILADFDGGGTPGLAIEKGGKDWDENDAMRKQWWHVTAGPLGLPLGHVQLVFWSVPEGDYTARGTVWAHLVECDADGVSNCFVISSRSIDQDPWAASPGQTRRDIDFGVIGHTVPAGKVLRLVLEAERAEGNYMHFGFDTTSNPSALTIG
jgi:hypothetical protein